MRERSWKRLGWTTVGVAYGFVAILAVLAIADATPPPVREDAQEVAPPTAQLSEVAVDPFYSTPTPAPQERCGPSSVSYDSLTAVLGDLQICDARLRMHGDTSWRTPMGVER